MQSLSHQYRRPGPGDTATRLIVSIALVVSGCGGDARVEMSAATAIDRIAAGMTVALDEYHRDVSDADARREDAVVDAFIERVRRDHEDARLAARHADAFREAVRRLRHDRDVEWTRYTAMSDDVVVLREIADGLRRLAVESTTLSDEARRYLGDLVARQQSAQGPTTGDRDASTHAEPGRVD